MFKKLLAAVGVIAVTIGLVALVAGPASAHDHNVAASCATGVTVTLTNYHVDHTGDTPNHVTVTVDGSKVVDNVAFGSTFVNTYAWPVVPQATHTYRVSVTAVDHQSGKDDWSFDTGLQTVSGCAQSTSAGSVEHTDPYCSGPGVVGAGGYTIPNIPAALYTVTIAGNSTVKGAGTYPVDPGTVVHVVASPASSAYTLTGQTVWDFTIATIDASTCIVPAAPVFTASTCSAATPGVPTPGTYTIPTSANGVTYVLKGTTTPLDAKTYQVTTFPSTVDIVAVIPSGYTVPAETKTEWTFTFASPGDCVVNSTVIAPAANQETCLTSQPGVPVPGTYTLTAVTGIQYQVTVNTNAPIIQTSGTYNTSPGDTVLIQAQALPGYRLVAGADGKTSWTFSYTSIQGGCLVQVSPVDPTFTEEVCDTAHPGQSFSGSYTIVATDHVHFEVQINNAAYVSVSPGQYSVSPGDVVTVKVLPDAGYTISPLPDPAALTHTFGAALDCLVTVPPVKPDATSQSCVPAGSGGSQGQLGTTSPTDVLTDAYITIPATTGVQYFINQKAYGAGQVILPPGDYTVTAQALMGYTLDTAAYPVGGWLETLTSAEPCGDLITHPLVDPSASQVQLGCFTSGSYVLSNDLNDSDAIIWTVNGSTVSQGTYKVSAAGTYQVHAEANGPSYGLETDAQQDWTFVFAQPTTCDLKTLAFTGSSPTGWLALGYLFLVSGLGLIAVRFARRRGRHA